MNGRRLFVLFSLAFLNATWAHASEKLPASDEARHVVIRQMADDLLRGLYPQNHPSNEQQSLTEKLKKSAWELKQWWNEDKTQNSNRKLKWLFGHSDAINPRPPRISRKCSATLYWLNFFAIAGLKTNMSHAKILRSSSKTSTISISFGNPPRRLRNSSETQAPISLSSARQSRAVMCNRYKYAFALPI